MDTNKKIREHISAFLDGELSTNEDLDLALAALHTSDGAAAWEAYHLIGDVLRTPAAPALSSDFRARLDVRLAAEPALSRRSNGAVAEAQLKPAVATTT
jgi:sigma-E factor negative regulatory protein RseA